MTLFREGDVQIGGQKEKGNVGDFKGLNFDFIVLIFNTTRKGGGYEEGKEASKKGELVDDKADK